jgi:hypothetical protein
MVNRVMTALNGSSRSIAALGGIATPFVGFPVTNRCLLGVADTGYSTVTTLTSLGRLLGSRPCCTAFRPCATVPTACAVP